MQTKQEQKQTNIVTSCHQVESCILNHPIEKVWCALKEMNLTKTFSSCIKSYKFTEGGPNQVGSVLEVNYKDDSVWTFRVLEISDLRNSMSMELISTKPEVTFTSMLTTTKLYKVTEDNTTFIKCESYYSSDVNIEVIEDRKYKKLELFNDLKKLS